ncbi:4-hydroxy-tetrahydrodipicolinate reductase 2, chloroplastic-like [Melia azedarach]|uniref:4-hydroxy-tetrahydrodipicolinate reductase 2, chloroplastic-like n=1 Tax=Melia azedarach TaxID=155640 RepID=A0ACC1YLM4_MELAZ|nr:4-hydroxy-tetrahydrodipicolinate reductase 2, chloroplastic-like [Melia azedarach]
MASLLKAPSNSSFQLERLEFFTGSRIRRQCNSNSSVAFSKPRSLVPVVLSMSTSASAIEHLEKPISKNIQIPVMVNSCTGKMGKAVMKAADSAWT